MTESLAILFLAIAAVFFLGAVVCSLINVAAWDWYREAWSIPFIFWRMTVLAGAIGAGLRYLSLQ